jgi:hypothetical protein
MFVARTKRELTARTVLRVHGVIFSAMLIALGIQFLRPEKTFMGPIYAEMAKVASENLWAGTMLTVGAARLSVIIYGATQNGGEKPISPLASAFMTGLSGIIWLAMAFVFSRVNPLGWSLIAATGLACCDMATCIMVSGIAGTASGRVRNGQPTLPA